MCSCTLKILCSLKYYVELHHYMSFCQCVSFELLHIKPHDLSFGGHFWGAFLCTGKPGDEKKALEKTADASLISKIPPWEQDKSLLEWLRSL